MNDVRLLLVDLDGTLIGPDLVPGADDVAALNAAMDAGVVVAIATGRAWESARLLTGELPGLQYIISSNGGAAIAVHSGQAIYAAPGFNHEVLADLEVLAERHDVAMNLYTANAWYVTRQDARVIREARRSGAVPQECGSWRDIQDSVVKVLYLGEPSSLATIRLHLADMAGGVIPLDAHYDDYLDVSPAGVSKGVATRALREWLDIPTARVMAIGNGENDVSMFRESGIGVALRDSCPELIDAATHLTTGVTEGAVWSATRGLVFGDPAAQRNLWRPLHSLVAGHAPPQSAVARTG